MVLFSVFSLGKLFLWLFSSVASSVHSGPSCRCTAQRKLPIGHEDLKRTVRTCMVYCTWYVTVSRLNSYPQYVYTCLNTSTCGALYSWPRLRVKRMQVISSLDLYEEPVKFSST
ncbi:hypothetical protein BDY19DRAFT_558799 [Irpex rosettiformis]|uniref:Uncharacterized protein n=1 Tax=Irpex rosettiformis TaxID=378272 RepID=A0ACB8TQ12_9APHY|nr:hypothetical protein BDY19DRAFT_558799 [Irpex rosettiformis]